MKTVRKTGNYERTSVTGETVQAFVPFPLPPTQPALVVDTAIQSQLAEAEQKLAQLRFASQMVPSLDWFIYAYVRKEAVTSSQIEGTQATLMDLLEFESNEKIKSQEHSHLEEICNYLEAIKFARASLQNPKGLPLSMRLLNETHKRLMTGARGGNKQPGEIRKSQNWIGGSRPGNATFVPPPPHEVHRLLSELEKYIHGNDTLHPLIRIGLLHVQFETIHPYLDGNGRMGRLLITLLLENWNLLDAPLLYLSLYFKKNRHEYYRLLGEVRLTGDWEAWIQFFLKGICEMADDATTLTKELFAIVSADHAKVLAEANSSLIVVRLFELLPTHPIISMPQIVKLLGISKPTALKAIRSLEKLGILTEITGRIRDRHFAYTDYLQKLRVGTELKVYRVVLEYGFEDFVIKDGAVEFTAKSNDDFVFESEIIAKKYYKKIVAGFANKTPSLRTAELQIYDSASQVWHKKESASLSQDSDFDHPTTVTSDVVPNKLQILQALVKITAI